MLVCADDDPLVQRIGMQSPLHPLEGETSRCNKEPL